MTDTTLSSKQPSGAGLDYADPTKFKFQISKLPRVEFNSIQANIPGIRICCNLVGCVISVRLTPGTFA